MPHILSQISYHQRGGAMDCFFVSGTTGLEEGLGTVDLEKGLGGVGLEAGLGAVCRATGGVCFSVGLVGFDGGSSLKLLACSLNLAGGTGVGLGFIGFRAGTDGGSLVEGGVGFTAGGVGFTVGGVGLLEGGIDVLLAREGLLGTGAESLPVGLIGGVP